MFSGLKTFHKTKAIILSESKIIALAIKIILKLSSEECSLRTPAILKKNIDGIATTHSIIAKYLGLLNLVVIENNIGDINISPTDNKKTAVRKPNIYDESGFSGKNNKIANDKADRIKPMKSFKNELV